MTARSFALVLLTTGVVVTVRLALLVLPSSVIIRFVRRISVDTSAGYSSFGFDLATIIWAVEAVSARVPGATCLTKAISAKLLLRWSGVRSELCLGVAYAAEGSLRAHAWLEREGRTIIGGTIGRAMVRLPELPNTRRGSAPYSR